MIGAVIWLLAFQLAGELAARLLGLPLPGAVLGLALLFGVLAVRGGVPADWSTLADGLHRHLLLLLVPGTVALVDQLDRLAREALPIILAVLAGTALTLAATALALRALRGVAPADTP